MVKINITPMAKPRMTQRDIWAKRSVVVRYYDYCDALRDALPDYQLPGELVVDFYLPMAPSWSKKKREEHFGKPHQLKPDIDNLCKAFMDAFHADDSHVWKINARKIWSESGYIELVDANIV